MEEDAVKAAADLTTAGVNVIIYGCTSGSFIGGPDWEAKLTHTLEEETGLPAITTTRAVIEGLKVLNAKKIVVATPYPHEIDEKEREFLENKGFRVLAMKGLGIIDNLKVGLQAPETAYRLVKEIFMPEADAVFISCTNFRTIEIIEALELDLIRPAITSTQASMWAALRKLNIKDKTSGFGKLLREHL
jgi:maleate isomerase